MERTNWCRRASMVSLLLCSVDWSDVDKASRSCTRPLISHAGRLLAAAELLLLPLDEADDRDEVGASTLARLALGAAVLDVELVPHNHVEIEIIRCKNRKARARAVIPRSSDTRSSGGCGSSRRGSSELVTLSLGRESLCRGSGRRRRGLGEARHARGGRGVDRATRQWRSL